MKTKSLVIGVATAIVVLCLAAATAGLLALRREDRARVDVVARISAFVDEFCAEQARLPTEAEVRRRFPALDPRRGWLFFEGRDQLALQYPISWWRDFALGGVRISGFTATPYAYDVAFKCVPGPA